VSDLIGYYPHLVRQGIYCGIDLKKLAARLWKLDAMRGEDAVPEMRIRAARLGRVSGHAKIQRKIISLNLGDNELDRIIELVLHELVHCACPPYEYHGELFMRRIISCAREAFGLDLNTATLLDTDILHYSKRAYAVDERIIEAMKTAKIGERLRADSELRFESLPPETEQQIAEHRAAARSHLIDKRANHAREMLARWESKEKHAKRLVSKWRTKVRYYERRGS